MDENDDIEELSGEFSELTDEILAYVDAASKEELQSDACTELYSSANRFTAMLRMTMFSKGVFPSITSVDYLMPGSDEGNDNSEASRLQSLRDEYAKLTNEMYDGLRRGAAERRDHMPNSIYDSVKYTEVPFLELKSVKFVSLNTQYPDKYNELYPWESTELVKIIPKDKRMSFDDLHSLIASDLAIPYSLGIWGIAQMYDPSNVEEQIYMDADTKRYAALIKIHDRSPEKMSDWFVRDNRVTEVKVDEITEISSNNKLESPYRLTTMTTCSMNGFIQRIRVEFESLSELLSTKITSFPFLLADTLMRYMSMAMSWQSDMLDGYAPKGWKTDAVSEFTNLDKASRLHKQLLFLKYGLVWRSSIEYSLSIRAGYVVFSAYPAQMSNHRVYKFGPDGICAGVSRIQLDAGDNPNGGPKDFHDLRSISQYPALLLQNYYSGINYAYLVMGQSEINSFYHTDQTIEYRVRHKIFLANEDAYPDWIKEEDIVRLPEGVKPIIPNIFCTVYPYEYTFKSIWHEPTEHVVGLIRLSILQNDDIDTIGNRIDRIIEGLRQDGAELRGNLAEVTDYDLIHIGAMVVWVKLLKDDVS